MELNIKKFSNKVYQLNLDKSDTSSDIHITIPDLSDLKYFVWGDWGPMYTFHLSENTRISIKDDQGQYYSAQTKLRVNSPSFVKERERFPFYFIVDFHEKSLRFNIYIDENYELGKVETIKLKEATEFLVNTPEASAQAIY